MSMRPRVIWFVIASSVLFLLAFGVHRLNSRRSEGHAVVAGVSASAAGGAHHESERLPRLSSGQPLSQSTAPAPVEPGLTKEEQIRKALSTYNDEPIRFYGKLVDQFGNPVPSAIVDFTVRVINGYESTTDRGRTVSDAAGMFSISGYKGQDLSVNPSKAGYVLSSIHGIFNYSHLFPESERVHPDPGNPTVIEMWKLQGAERLISFRIEGYVPCEGTPADFDLQTGERVQSGGDVTLTVWSTNAPSLKNGYSWKARIQAVQGGLVQAFNVRPEQMLGAPESGYAGSFDLNYNYEVRPWSSRFTGAFYFTSRGGQFYGRLTLQILSDVVKDGGAYVSIQGMLNPAGSRDLEVDPKLVSQAHP